MDYINSNVKIFIVKDLDKAGFKTTIHSEMGKDGTKRIRIRVVPFKNKDEAQRAIEKIKELKIPGAKLDLIPQP